MQSYKVPSSQVPGHSYITRHPDFKDGSQGQEYKDITTLWDLFQHEVTVFSKREFLGVRTFDPPTGRTGSYQWITTTEAGDIVEDFGSGLDHIYSKYAPECPAATPGQQPLAICVPNRVEWLLAEFAAFRSRRYSVGISDGVDIENAEMAINNSESAVVVCSMDKIPRMLNRIRMTPSIKVVISMDNLDCSRPTISTQPFSAESVAELRRQAESLGVVLLDMADVVDMGREKPTDANPPKPSDISTICYTSGTLAAKKGAICTHNSNVFASKCAYFSGRLSDSTYLSFVPLSCCSERNTVYALMYEHCRIGMFSGTPENLIDDFQQLSPTVFLTDPTLLNKVYDKAAAATIHAPGMVGAMARYAYSSKLQIFKRGGGTKHAFWDKILFSKVAQIFGGRVRTIYCGGTALIPEVHDFFRIALSCDLLQGYGQTETFGCGVLQLATDTTTGNIGVPMPGVDMRLRSIPDMNLSATSPICPKGELMIRGKCLFSGYLKLPENSKNLMDDEGWMATDDIARFNEDGTISIIGRMKNSFKTARFCWVAPESMELMYSAHPLVHNIFVHGTPDERDLIAIVSPEREPFIQWAQKYLTRDTSSSTAKETTAYKEICSNEAVCNALVDELRNIAIKNNLQSRAYIAAVHCDPTPFESSNGELFTSTRKLRRNVAAEYYKNEISKLFAELDNSEAPVNLK
ncbi:medium-chain fatty acid-CoA ligase faa2 [Coemansia sp. RSA 1813]|nr:medium-chain fatty acid-CoA ligase faa2 [Coemansia sp. RSA 1813]